MLPGHSATAMRRVRMGDLTLHVPADGGYEHQVARLEAWLIDNGVPRRGADFIDLPDDDWCARCGVAGVEGVHRA